MHARTAIVIGGTGGLGSAICRKMADDWAQIIVGYRKNAAAARELAGDIGGESVCCDLSDADGVLQALNFANSKTALGAIVFAGGVEIGQPFVSAINEAEWRTVLETEIIGFTRVVSSAIPILRAAGGGSITAISSVANYAYPPGDALSSVPKAAIESLCRAVAKEEGRYQIRANAVAPGIIDAGLGAQFLKDLYSPEIWDTQRQRVALRRFGSAGEVAEAVAFLASDRSKYITGQTLLVDGGFSL